MTKPAQRKKRIKSKITAEQLRQKLKLRHLKAKTKFSKNYPQFEKFLKDKNFEIDKIREHSARLLGAGALSGALLLAPPVGKKALSLPSKIVEKLNQQAITVPIQQKLLLDALPKILPKRVSPLTRTEEKYLEKLFKEIIGIKTKATLEGEHLNTTYGYVGAEQHLRRYPGDSLRQHGESVILREGMAPGLGAWGYFASSKNKLTPELAEIEKWYAVVQTLYLPDWNRRQPYLRDWYKYRKVLIVNVKNGNAVVAAIADAGPAAWTGKSFGASPETMHYLGGSRYKKGAVILFFVDDPENKVPLGPVDYNKISLPEVALDRI